MKHFSGSMSNQGESPFSGESLSRIRFLVKGGSRKVPAGQCGVGAQNIHFRQGTLVNGEYVVVEEVQHELLESPVKVYNFQVEDYHTYYVSDSGVLVHNTCTKNHGNSLSTDKKTELYVLRDKDTGIVKKIGETTRGTRRYTQKFYNTNNVEMQIIGSGSKRAMHYQQHRLLKKYLSSAGRLPSLNKSLW